jgi:hypothetical protein
MIDALSGREAGQPPVQGEAATAVASSNHNVEAVLLVRRVCVRAQCRRGILGVRWPAYLPSRCQDGIAVDAPLMLRWGPMLLQNLLQCYEAQEWTEAAVPVIVVKNALHTKWVRSPLKRGACSKRPLCLSDWCGGPKGWMPGGRQPLSETALNSGPSPPGML